MILDQNGKEIKIEKKEGNLFEMDWEGTINNCPIPAFAKPSRQNQRQFP